MTPLSARALWYIGEGACALRPVAITSPGKDEAQVRTLFSAISRGTERLIFSGKVPPSEYQRMRGPNQEGDFPFPVKYGYCATGIVEKGPSEWLGKTVFALHPHQTHFTLPVTALTPIPDTVPAERATLAANMETALNGVWDSGAGPGDRIVVVGAGIVGLLVASLCASLPGAEVTVVDVQEARRPLAEALGAAFATPQTLQGEADIVFHASVTAAGLTTALEAAAFEATIVELSWFGDAFVGVPLGGAFHSKRLRLISSQVGHVSAGRRQRWSYARRMGKALDLLADTRLDALIDTRLAFDDLPQSLPKLFSPGAAGLTALVQYS
jgi:NADPH:quinone reductase-like Zn-dependent oxidoreductase